MYWVRHLYLRRILRIKIGRNSAIHMGCFFTGNNIAIGNNSVINRRTYLDGRYGIWIGNNVSISPECYLLSLTHDVNDNKFSAVGRKVKIEDYAWIGVRVIILPGVNVATGSVIGAGSVVTKSINNANTIVAGAPARFIRERVISSYDYKISYFPFFDTDIAI